MSEKVLSKRMIGIKNISELIHRNSK